MKRRDHKHSTPRQLTPAELVKITGGGRYGSGPDFNDIKDSSGNYAP